MVYDGYVYASVYKFGTKVNGRKTRWMCLVVLLTHNCIGVHVKYGCFLDCRTHVGKFDL